MRLFNCTTVYEDFEFYSKSLPIWVTASTKSFIDVITNKDIIFPCHFAASSYKQNCLFLTYLEAVELNDPVTILEVIKGYLEKVRESNEFTALVVFIRTEYQDREIDYYENTFWKLLQFIHDKDCDPWPINATKNSSDRDWKFYFNSTALFINAHSSHFIKRKSRLAPSDLMLIIQPFKNLENLENHSKNPQAISNRIREYVRCYDSMEISKVFGKSYTDIETLNWKQFWVSDDDKYYEEKLCPLKID